MTSPLTIFISSTFEDARNEREYIARVCEEMGFQVLYFPEGSVAGSGQRDYLSAERGAHLLVYLLTAVDSDAVKEEIALAEEIGLYVIPIARASDQKMIDKLLRDKSRRVLRGTKYVSTFGTLAQLREIVRAAVASYLARRLDGSQALSEWGPAAYEDAAVRLAATTDRVGLSQSTSSLFLGPRVDRLQAEGAFLRNLDSFLLRSPEPSSRNEVAAPDDVGPPQPLLIHIYNEAETARELEENARLYPYAADRHHQIKDIYRPLQSMGLVLLCGMDEDIYPLMVTDNSCEIGTRLAGRVFYGSFSEGGRSAGRLWSALLQEALSRTPSE